MTAAGATGPPASAGPRRQPRPAARRRAVALLVLVLLAVGAAAVVDARMPRAATPPAAPVEQGPAEAGTWYCPAVAAEDESGMLTVAAVGRDSSTVTVTRYGGEGPVDDPALTIAPGDAVEVPLAAGEASQPVSVRWQGGPAVAHWRIDGARDSGAAPCEPAPSARWHATGFDTTLGSSSFLHLFNPFGEDAVARLVFATPDGPVRLVIADNQLIEAGSSRRLDLTEFRPEETDLGVTVEVLTGRLVAQGEVVFAPPGEESGTTGRVLLPASPAPSLGWGFAYARAAEGSASWLSVQNPGEREAAIELRVSDPLPDSEALLSEVSVPAGGTVRIDLGATSVQPEFGVQVVSVNEAPVVASLLWSLRTDQGRRGVTAALGAPAPATEWALPGAGSDGRAGKVSVYNPGADAATVAVLAEGAPPSWSELTLPPNGRGFVELVDAGRGRPSIAVRVVSDRPVVAELRSLSSGESVGLWTNVGIPALDWTGPESRPPVRLDPSLRTRSVEPRPTETAPLLPPTVSPDGEGVPEPAPAATGSPDASGTATATATATADEATETATADEATETATADEATEVDAPTGG